MKWNKEVPAFTLMEMLVVMVLSGLVSSAVYFSYLAITTYHQKLSANLDRFSSLREMTWLLQRDVEKCEKIKMFEANQIELSVKTGKIYYRFLADKIVRQQGSRTDEYLGAFEMPEFYFQNARILSLNEKIDEIKLKTMPDQPLTDLVLYKEYDMAGIIYSDSVKTTNE